MFLSDLQHKDIINSNDGRVLGHIVDAEITKMNLLKKLNITHACGSDLVNIKFQNCSEKVALTKIYLFDDKKQIMGTFKVDGDMFYKSITNLAYGKYFYKAQPL